MWLVAIKPESEVIMPIPEYIRELRTKIGHDLLLMPAITAVVINDSGEVLLQQRADTGEWGLISGIMEPGEEPSHAVIREVHEETDLDVVPERIAGVYSGPDFLIRYKNGDEVIYLDMVFVCRSLGGQPRVNDEESLAIQYFPLDALPSMGAIHHMRLEQVLRNEVKAYFRFNPEQELTDAHL
jgi:8-oxo-dGTP pyrophosphatase MutT (NUDIX family)